MTRLYKPRHSQIFLMVQNFWFGTPSKRATKIECRLLVVHSTVIFSKRRKINAFWSEPKCSADRTEQYYIKNGNLRAKGPLFGVCRSRYGESGPKFVMGQEGPSRSFSMFLLKFILTPSSFTRGLHCEVPFLPHRQKSQLNYLISFIQGAQLIPSRPFG